MAKNSKIEWTDSTFNPWTGCTKVSPGCDHCYAESWAKRSGTVIWGVGEPRRRTTPANWGKPLKWNAAHAEFFAQHGRRQRVFCASLADVFDNSVDPAWRMDLFRLIESTPNLDWLLLTKRIGNAGSMSQAAMGAIGCIHKALPPNVWLGATIVNREEMLRDAAKLNAVPARVRFWSVEPLLDDLGEIPPSLLPHWVIVGGESGGGARPMHPQWARDIRDQCAAAGVPMLFKQWGEWTPGENVERSRGVVDTAFLWNGGWQIHPLNLTTDQGHIDDQPDLYRVGKKAAGRHLDGETHDGFPASEAHP